MNIKKQKKMNEIWDRAWKDALKRGQASCEFRDTYIKTQFIITVMLAIAGSFSYFFNH